MTTSISLPGALPPRPMDRTPNRLQRWCRGALFRGLRSIHEGRIRVVDGDGTFEFGSRHGDPDMTSTIVVIDPGTYLQIATRGSVGAGESWMEGAWCCDNLTALMRVLARNDEAAEKLEGGLARLGIWMVHAYHLSRRNTLRGSRGNISDHYDLGNRFYSLWLDRTMTYSCALFEGGESELERAQERKYEAICDHLDLDSRDHVLEIGCGWGGFAGYAARHRGCRVTGVTLSREQYEFATERMRGEGLEHLVTVELRDYRNLEGRFDKIVSIEMFEAVGHEFQDRFFEVCERVLRPGGRMLLQTITIAPERHGRARGRADFIQRYIFPGGALPSIPTLEASLAKTRSLSFSAVHDISAHYAETVRIWRTRFTEAREQVLSLGFPERFLRMWEFYLCYCEGGFRENSIGTVQALIERGENPASP